MTRLLALLALAAAAVFGVLAHRQGGSMVLREGQPASYWLRGNATLTGSYEPGRGSVSYTGRSEWAGFRGGGPGAGK